MYKDRGLYIPSPFQIQTQRKRSFPFQNQMQIKKEALTTINSISIIARATVKNLNHSLKAS
jgi:hypothetical protein